jgi:hypothetical protein
LLDRLLLVVRVVDEADGNKQHLLVAELLLIAEAPTRDGSQNQRADARPAPAPTNLPAAVATAIHRDDIHRLVHKVPTLLRCVDSVHLAIRRHLFNHQHTHTSARSASFHLPTHIIKFIFPFNVFHVVFNLLEIGGKRRPVFLPGPRAPGECTSDGNISGDQKTGTHSRSAKWGAYRVSDGPEVDGPKGRYGCDHRSTLARIRMAAHSQRHPPGKAQTNPRKHLLRTAADAMRRAAGLPRFQSGSWPASLCRAPKYICDGPAR